MFANNLETVTVYFRAKESGTVQGLIAKEIFLGTAANLL